jgi:hypothetical protein
MVQHLLQQQLVHRVGTLKVSAEVIYTNLFKHESMSYYPGISKKYFFTEYFRPQTRKIHKRLEIHHWVGLEYYTI